MYICSKRKKLKKKINPAKSCCSPWAWGMGRRSAYNSKTVYDIEMKFGGVVENHKLTDFVCSQTSLRRTPSGPASTVCLREPASVL